MVVKITIHDCECKVKIFGTVTKFLTHDCVVLNVGIFGTVVKIPTHDLESTAKILAPYKISN